VPTDLDQFAKLFATEHDLQIALVDLFSKIPGTLRVQILQGALEHGKDIVFRRDLLPGYPILIACVVKNHPIGGSAYESRKSAATVMNQVRQALKNPFRDTDGTLVPVHMVYVITPYEVSREAILSVEGELIELHGRFEFLCGSHLLDLFRDHYPSYITFKGDVFNSYLRTLISHLESESPLSAVARSETLLSTIYASFVNTYVEPRFAAQFTTAHTGALSNIRLPLDYSLSRHALEQELTKLYRVSSLLFHSESWITTAASLEWPRQGLRLSKLAKSLPGWWEEEASRYISRGGAVGSLVDRSTIEVAVPASYAADFDLPTLREAVSACAREFDELMRRAKDAWGTLHVDCKAYVDLFSYAPLSYVLRAQEIIGRCPHLFHSSREMTPIAASQADLTSQDRSFAVTAPPGYGKTTFCKWNAINDAKAMLEAGGTVFPVYVPLHRFNEVEVGDIELLTPEVRDFLSSRQAKEHRLSRIRVYLDGLDELRTRKKKNALLARAAAGLDVGFPIQFIITARDSAFNAMMAIYPRFRIGAITLAEAHQLVAKLLADRRDEIKEFWRQIADCGTLTEVLKVPLLLQLIVSVFNKTQKIPQNRYRLYQMFLELLAHGWDRAKSVERAFVYESELKLKVMQVLAGRLHSQGRREATTEELQMTIEGITSPGAIDLTVFVAELLHQGLLVQSGTSYLFAHLSFQEYLAARDLNDPTGIRQGRALMSFLKGDDWWREVISFYINGHSSPSDLELWACGGVNRSLLSVAKGDHGHLASRVQLLRDMFASSHPGFQVRLPYVGAPGVERGGKPERGKPGQ